MSKQWKKQQSSIRHKNEPHLKLLFVSPLVLRVVISTYDHDSYIRSSPRLLGDRNRYDIPHKLCDDSQNNQSVASLSDILHTSCSTSLASFWI
jgi:hypothetical protein